ncbi:MAG: EAL domain-containing protein [Gammaproteobacteria bacterium]|nr:EAL domain-containing protein [Gammaproteobacteria bacterium]
MKKNSSNWILSLGFSSLLGLMILVIYIPLSEMSTTISKMEALVKITNAKISTAHAMRDYIRLRASTLSQMYLTDDYFERHELYPLLAHHAANYRAERVLLLQHEMDDDETELLEKIRVVSEEGYRANILAANILLSRSSDNEVKEAQREAYNARQKVLDHLDELVEMQNKNAQQALDVHIRVNKETRNLVIVISSLVLFLGIAISIFSIRETTRKSKEIHFQAHHDDLTHLPNRKAFEYRLQLALGASKERNLEHVLCFLDLDQFKVINDTCGHIAGDQLLINISKLIHEKIRERDTLGRLGGDEFGILLESCSLEKAIEISEGIVNLVRNYRFNWQDRIFQIGVSIGIVHINKESKDVVSLMSEADIACYAAKDMGRNRVHVHELNDEQVKKIHQELSWVADIETSLKDQRFKLYIQAIAHIDTKNTDRMYEVLLRLKDDDGNIISPGEYIPAAERFNLMHAVDIWVVHETIEKINALSQSGRSKVPQIFINLSANSITDPDFCDYVLDLLKHYSIPKYSICFEITETAAIKNMEQAISFITRLKKAHCLFALDDFGSGMSSFTYLKNLPVDYLKIDGSLVNKMDKNKSDQAMVAAINQIGQVMNIKTIAEHVESQTILSGLNEIGVTYAQGYYIGKPFSIDELSPD